MAIILRPYWRPLGGLRGLRGLSTIPERQKSVIMDGNTAAAHAAYAMVEQAFIYPISPSSPMCELAAEWAAQGRKNVFGTTVNVTQMQSEGTLGSLMPWETVRALREGSLSPQNPHARACNTGTDVWFQGMEASNRYYDATPGIVQSVLDDISRVTGRGPYHLFELAGDPEARHVVVCMGSAFSVLAECVPPGHAAVNVRLYRPWSPKDFLACLPPTVERVTVLDRTKDNGAVGEPLFMDVATSFMAGDKSRFRKIPEVLGGRYGLGSKDLTPKDAMAVFRNGELAEPKKKFTVGIVDDVTQLSLPPIPPAVVPQVGQDVTECAFFAMGSDGTVSANKNAIKLIGDNTDLFVQGHIVYDSKKAGGATVSHLRFGKEPINKPYEIVEAGYVAVHEPTWPKKFPKAIMAKLRDGGTLVINSHCSTAEELEKILPAEMLQAIYEKNAELWVVDALSLAKKFGLGKHINNVMQAVFFKLGFDASVLNYETKALPMLLDSLAKTYARKGEDTIRRNSEAAKAATASLVRIQVPEAWATAEATSTQSRTLTGDATFDNISYRVGRMEGSELPVSAIEVHGRYPTGMTKYEKRGIAPAIPIVDMDKCTQCNLCSIICPHAAIRPFLLNTVENDAAPTDNRPAKGGAEVQGFSYRVQVSPLDCTGCEACSWICPDDALTMVNVSTLGDDPVVDRETANWDYLINLPERSAPRHNSRDTARQSQLALPMLEFSGACAGCGETPYAKLVTQLFGERMVISNASGCSGVWGAAAGFSSYTKNDRGEGPAWGRSLYEDAAEYGLGAATATHTRRKFLREQVAELLGKTRPDSGLSPTSVDLLYRWSNGGWKDPAVSQDIARVLPKSLMRDLEGIPEGDLRTTIEKVLSVSGEFVKVSHWVFGGDGWAYDIGFGGLDHVLASGTDINVMVMDTEGYANTGGQKSKATQLSAVQKFATDGYRRPKKNLAEMFMGYGNVYVASIAVGASPSQSVKALIEADSYAGPSIVLTYSPCIEHKIKFPRGLSRLAEEMAKAVNTGYWPLFRYDPAKIDSGMNPFVLDAPKRLTGQVHDFTDLEDRFGALERTHPEDAKSLAVQLQTHITNNFEALRRRHLEGARASTMLVRVGVSPEAAEKEHGEASHRVLIVYGSDTGNTAELASRFGNMCRSRGVGVDGVLDMSEVDSLAQLPTGTGTTLVVMTSTVGEGDLPPTAEAFKAMLDSVDQGALATTRVAVFGLGDSSYHHFCGAAKALEESLHRAGAVRVAPTGLGDDQAEDKFETAFEQWTPTIWPALDAPQDEIISDPAALPSSPYSVAHVPAPPVSIDSPAILPSSSPPGTFPLAVTSNTRLTPEGYDRTVNHVTMKVFDGMEGRPHHDLSYHLGDALAMYPSNDPKAVSSWLIEYGLDPGAYISVATPPGDNRRGAFFRSGPVSLESVFTELLDLFGKPTGRFYRQLARFASDPEERRRIEEVSSTPASMATTIAEALLSFKYGAPVRLGAYYSAETVHPHTSVPFFMKLIRYYGARHKAKDFAFGDEFEGYTRAGVLTEVVGAFSRDQQEKVYVQHRIAQDHTRLYDLLVTKGGYFYLCGQAGHVQQEVEDALATALGSRDALDNLIAERRYSLELY
ncbi:hypothetical protein FOL47_000953 [Perkinsus chesapeaki]|uniref:Uncharacterized protein n=1 Tax=Perkinsus chesapeaki TaxID=330153 RepID=A0A7J6MKV8_PERCH|nr:hypothetical protein FOL47_000953 [Perkinsus chesapeaki]